MFEVVTLSEAKKLVEKNILSLEGNFEEISVMQADGLALVDNLIASRDFPLFTRSTMDGYAVKASDTFGVSENMPALLSLVGEVEMGKAPGAALSVEEIMYIPTGGMLPEGADSVIMIENTEKIDASTVLINKAVAPGENILKIGDDFIVGDLLLERGQSLKPQDIGLLAGAGITKVKVYKKPRIALISTGDEVIEPGKELRPGQIWDINSYALSAMIKLSGGVPEILGIYPDNYEVLKKAINKAVSEYDMLIISGGSSVGAKDNTARLINDAGNPGVIFHGISVKPGKPTIFGLIEDKPIFGLSGNPVSAMIVFDLLVGPAIQLLQGKDAFNSLKPTIKATMTRNLASANGREDFIRVQLKKEESGLMAYPVFGAAGLISPLVKCDGLLRIDQNTEGIKEGEIVSILPFPTNELR